jgi:hypothetical protein
MLVNLGDLYLDAGRRGDSTFQQVAEGYLFRSQWYPPDPGPYSWMGFCPVGYLPHLDPWAKIHLGFVRPLVVTRDGTYTLSDVETTRNFSAQENNPEAIIIFDPLRSDPYNEYFILENRNQALQPDQGLAVWLIDESTNDWRKAVRLIRRGGHWTGQWVGSPPQWREDYSLFFWDGVPQTDGYDLTATSTPRNTSWTDRSPSYIEVYDISAAGPTMTFKVRMPPIFVNKANTGSEDGSQAHPYNTVLEGISAIPEPPRTIRIAGGSYPETMVINTPCTLMGWKNGNVVIGQ